MCGRYVLTTPVEALRKLFRFAGPALNLAPRWNIAPTQSAPVIRLADQARELAMLRWGLVPYWAEDVAIGAKMINARGDTVATKPAFRAAFKSRRCLIPADGFYEWQTVGPARPKQPVLFRQQDGSAFAFAGIWERWVPPGGGVLESYAIITTDASQAMAQYHDRFPLILSPDDHARWLDPQADASALLKPPPAEWFTVARVSTYVNDVKHDDEGCFAPMLETAEAPPAAKSARAKEVKKKDDRQTSLF